MPVELSEVARMAACGLWVAMVAVPVGLLALAARPEREPLLPSWKPPRPPWNGVEVIAAFLVGMLLPSLVLEPLTNSGFYQHVYGPDFPTDETAPTLRGLWASLFALPLQLGALAVAWPTLHPKWRPSATGSVAGRVALAVVAWCALAPSVLLLNAVVNAVSQLLDLPPEEHALTKLGGRPLLDQVLLAVEACVSAPLREEILIRGLLLWWCVGRLRVRGDVSLPPGARPWVVMAVATALAATGGRWQPLAFAAVLAVGLGVLCVVTRTGARRARAVYATAAFFALMHPVWPNPLPLFALGLGLGYLAVRTNGLLAPVLVHGLFNAVSVAFVLWG